ncbi:MAG: hypothetical protein Q9196_006760 [Gyalolechia fulgens]
MATSASTAVPAGHKAEEFRVDGHGQVQIGDRHYHPNPTTPTTRFHNEYYEIPRDPSPVFTGREEIGKLLEARCLPSSVPENQRQQRRFVIYGLGGSGKTQVCLKFAEDHREKFWGIFWMDASSTESLERGYLHVAKVCGLASDIDVVRRWLTNISEPWALILDNADDPRLDISSFFPAGNRGVVLVTTRNPDCRIHATVGSYELGAMTTDDAVTLILKASGSLDPSDRSTRAAATPVVLTLGCLALAITHAGAVIRQGYCAIGEYCALYSRRRKELLNRKVIQGGEDYQYTVLTTWEVSRKMIEEMSSTTGQDALELLQIFGFLHYEGIPEDLFYRAWCTSREFQLSEWFLSHQPKIIRRQSSPEWDIFPLREALSLLLSFSLIHRNQNNLISIHPLVHTWVRDRLSPSDGEMIWTQTTSTLALSIPRDMQTADYRFRQSLVPHIDACMAFQKDGIFFLQGIGYDCQWMAGRLSLVYHEVGRYQEALQLIERTVEAEKKTLGDEHPDTLSSIHNLVTVYTQVGRREEALPLSERLVEIRKRTLGDEHPNTLLSIQRLAYIYWLFNRYQDALNLLEPVVEARKRTLGDKHPNTLKAIHNLAIIYSELGRQEALQLMEGVVEASKRTLGDEHPDTLLAIHTLALRYCELDRQEALQLMEGVVEARKRTLGDEHPNTLLAIHNLAISYSELDRQEALQLMEGVVEARKRTLGDEHPDTLRAIYSVAVSYSELGRRQEALQLMEGVVEARKRTLGDEHPDTLDAIHHLAIRYSELGRQEALQLMEGVVEASKRTLGDEHPDTLRAIDNLAISYSELGRQEALQLIEGVVEVSKKTLGDEHPDTLDAIHGLSDIKETLKCSTERHQQLLKGPKDWISLEEAQIGTSV